MFVVNLKFSLFNIYSPHYKLKKCSKNIGSSLESNFLMVRNLVISKKSKNLLKVYHKLNYNLEQWRSPKFEPLKNGLIVVIKVYYDRWGVSKYSETGFEFSPTVLNREKKKNLKMKKLA